MPACSLEELEELGELGEESLGVGMAMAKQLTIQTCDAPGLTSGLGRFNTILWFGADSTAGPLPAGLRVRRGIDALGVAICFRQIRGLSRPRCRRARYAGRPALCRGGGTGFDVSGHAFKRRVREEGASSWRSKIYSCLG